MINQVCIYKIKFYLYCNLFGSLLFKVFVVCRRGNDSQLAVDLLKKHFSATDNSLKLESIKDLIGGLQEWTNSVDPNFPKY